MASKVISGKLITGSNFDSEIYVTVSLREHRKEGGKHIKS